MAGGGGGQLDRELTNQLLSWLSFFVISSIIRLKSKVQMSQSVKMFTITTTEY